MLCSNATLVKKKRINWTDEQYWFCVSEMDDEDCERRRSQCLDEMSDLEKQFLELKDK